MAKYDPLGDYLAARPEVVVRLSFGDITRIIAAALPASASKHPAWWANERDGGHVHARAWLDAGFTTRGLDLNARTVEFVRGAGAKRADTHSVTPN